MQLVAGKSQEKSVCVKLNVSEKFESSKEALQLLAYRINDINDVSMHYLMPLRGL